MAWRTYAMDTHFHHSLGAYEFDARCEMLAELGYDGTYLTLWSEPAWDDLHRLGAVERRFGLDVASVYATWDISRDATDEANARIVRMLRELRGCGTVELAMRSSGPACTASDLSGDDKARHALDVLLEAAGGNGLYLALYPHSGFWLERIEDAVRLCDRLDHPNLRAVFCGYHWYNVDGVDVAARLGEAREWLHRVNFCGSRRGLERCTIEPLDDGELDNFALLGHLQRIGYEGMVGFQGYGMGGDVYGKLRRSIEAYRDMVERLERRPDWAVLRPR